MSRRFREESRPSAPLPSSGVTYEPSPEPRPPESPFIGTFRCVGMARTADGFVTVTVDFGKDGIITGMVLGRPQSAPHGQPYVAGEAKRILAAGCLGV